MPVSESALCVLYAEDDFANRKLIELQLRRRGLECLAVEDGYQAIEAFKKGRFFLVILDFNMPGISGGETLQEIRKIDPKQKILALTSDDSIALDLIKQGFDRVVIKPSLDDSLMEAILELSSVV